MPGGRARPLRVPGGKPPPRLPDATRVPRENSAVNKPSRPCPVGLNRGPRVTSDGARTAGWEGTLSVVTPVPRQASTSTSVLPQHPVHSLTEARSSPALRLSSQSPSSRKPSLITNLSETSLGSHGPGLPPSQPRPHCGIAAAPVPRDPRAEVRHTAGPPFTPARTGFRSGLALGFRCHLPEPGHAPEWRRAHAPPGSRRQTPTQGLVSITVNVASVAPTDSILITRPGRALWGVAPGHPAFHSTAPLLNLHIRDFTNNILDRSQLHLRLLKTHFHQTAVKCNEQVWPGATGEWRLTRPSSKRPAAQPERERAQR